MSQTLVAYQFQDSDLVSIFRYCGYPPRGTGIVIFPEPWFFRYYLAIEARVYYGLTPNEAAVVLSYVATLQTLEAAIPAAAANLVADSAGPYVHNKNEIADRMALYTQWRLELCSILGVPPGPELEKKRPGIRFVL